MMRNVIRGGIVLLVGIAVLVAIFNGAPHWMRQNQIEKKITNLCSAFLRDPVRIARGPCLPGLYISIDAHEYVYRCVVPSEIQRKDNAFVYTLEPRSKTMAGVVVTQFADREAAIRGTHPLAYAACFPNGDITIIEPAGKVVSALLVTF